MRFITSKIIRKLTLPRPSSQKGDNGRLLVVAGSEKYHGSLLYAIKTAAKVVDLVYVLTTRENRELVKKLKEKTAEFISVHNSSSPPLILRGGTPSLKVREGWGELLKKIDCILIGPGMGESRKTYNLVRAVLKSKIRAVLDADALNVLDAKLLRLLGPQHILTPHKGEFVRLLQNGSTSPYPSPGLGREKGRGRNTGMERELRKFVEKHGCITVLKGRIDIIAQPNGKLSYNKTGNEGMTKGGTGDVLAGLISAFYCKNDAFTSAAAGVYVNGAAGDELYKKVGPYYDAEDLVEQLPKTLWKLIKK